MPKDKPSLGDSPVEAQYEREMTDVARAIDNYFNHGLKGSARTTGFILMVFPFGDFPDGRCNYMSNGVDRRDVVKLMEEQIKRFKEHGLDDKKPQ